MTTEATFSTILFQQGNNTGIEVPPGVVETLAAGKRPAVVVTVNGFEYRSAIAVMGGRYLIPFSSDKRAATGLAGGAAIDVTLVVDAAPRVVEVPADLDAALKASGLGSAFDALAPSARKVHVTSVESAKTPETRARRIDSIRAKLA